MLSQQQLILVQARLERLLEKTFAFLLDLSWGLSILKICILLLECLSIDRAQLELDIRVQLLVHSLSKPEWCCGLFRDSENV